jgi:protein gp37
MGKETGIKWTDSTYNSWWGCTKVSPACDHCYAEGVDRRTGENHWGHGAPRRLLSEHARNEPYRWQRDADAFEAEHGRRRRVFTLSMGDLFDNEVPDEWRQRHFDTMQDCDRLEWQICTKRISNLPKMIPHDWTPTSFQKLGADDEDTHMCWPQHVGVLITIVTQAEADRDVPRLLEYKRRFGIPWVGISYEPAQEGVSFITWLGDDGLDWIIFGGKSGAQWNDRPFHLGWARNVMLECNAFGTAFFMKQVAAFRPTDDMIPADLMIRQWPKGH